MKKVKPVKVTPAADIIAQQTAANRSAATENRQQNNIDVRGPTGDVTYTTGPDGRMTQTTSLNANQQGALGAQQSTASKLSQVADEMAGNINTGAFGIPAGLPDRVQSLDKSGMKTLSATDYGAARDSFSDAMYQRSKRLLDPKFAQEERAMRQRLSDQGLPQTGEAYDHDVSQFSQNRDRAYQDAADSAVAAGSQEQSRLFGLDNATNQNIINTQTADAGLRDSARNSGINEAYQVYNAPVDRIKSLYGAAPQTPVVNPQAFQGSNTAAVDTAGITNNVYNQQVAAAQAKAAQQNALLNAGIGLVGTLGGAAMGQGAFTSDENVKENFGSADSILDRVEEIPISSWTYKEGAVPGDDGSRHVGPMAQDFQGFFGLGNGKSIPHVDAAGVNLAATQQLAKKVRALEARVS